MPPNDWSEWQNHVLAELKRLNKSYDSLGESHKNEVNDLREEIHQFRKEVAVELTKLKMKAGTWGLMGAAIPVGLVIIIELLIRFLP